MLDRDRPPDWAEVPSAEELAAIALRRLARGGTWEGLSTELAWKAVQATGADPSCFEWLPEMIAAALSEEVSGFEYVIERERSSARVAHLHERPHDVAGAETAATLAADDEGARLAARLYVDALEWAIDVLDERLAQTPAPRRSRVRPLGRPAPLPEVEVPPVVTESLDGARPRYGWPRRPASADTGRRRAA